MHLIICKINKNFKFPFVNIIQCESGSLYISGVDTGGISYNLTNAQQGSSVWRGRNADGTPVSDEVCI